MLFDRLRKNSLPHTSAAVFRVKDSLKPPLNNYNKKAKVTMKKTLFFAVILSCMSPLSWANSDALQAKQKDVTELDMADLLKVQVTSVSKKAQALSDAPAAVFVISNEDIKRSGVTAVPEALRLAPGIDVARINSSKWAITARGFNGSAANKLLVLIDGRSVYTPGFSGVYWDAQDVLLEDVDRIEVIRGPGATLWGSNAVNGVINIITKRAEDTQGGLLTAGGGTRETGFGAMRYGKQLGEDSYGRVYMKGFQRDNFQSPNGNDNAGDSWNKQQGGFRVDSRLSNQDDLTVQGDLYRTNFNQALIIPSLSPPFQLGVNDKASNAGWNLTSRLKHRLSTTAEYTLQVYYDHTQRNEAFIQQSLDTFDVDFQNSFKLSERQNTIWGLDYRVNMDKFSNNTLITLNPYSRNTQLFSAFVQDEMTLIEEALWFTVGSKFEHNDYTGFEGQPTARLMWAPSPRQRIWTSVSRAVRTPARADQNINLLKAIVPTAIPDFGNAIIPVAQTVNGNQNIKSEVQLSYELGYRFTFSQKASLDITAFYNDYNNLRSTALGNPSISGVPPAIIINQPVYFNNLGKGSTYGFEAATVWQMTTWWSWNTNYSYLETYINNYQANPMAISPKHQASLRAEINPIDTVNLDFWLRYKGAATALTPLNERASTTRTIKGYVTLDVRLAWKAYPSLELSLAGQNLLADHHLEYIDESFILPSEIPRGVYGKVALEF
jgi:iron complex outermembrane receptor protein